MEARTEIKYKLVQFVSVGAACVLSLYLLADAESPLYKLTACGMAINMGVFWSYFLFLVLRAKRLHIIRVRTNKMKAWFGNIIFPTQYSEDRLVPVFSVKTCLRCAVQPRTSRV